MEGMGVGGNVGESDGVEEEGGFDGLEVGVDVEGEMDGVEEEGGLDGLDVEGGIVGVAVGSLVHTPESSPVEVTNVGEFVVGPLPSKPYAPYPAQRVCPVVQDTKQAVASPVAIVRAVPAPKLSTLRAVEVTPL
jgi:hypothetical protein